MHPDNVNESSIEKPSNENYEADIKYTMRYTRWLLQVLGIWPLISENSSKMAKHVSKILIPFCFIIPTFIFVPGLHYTFMSGNNIVANLVQVPPLLFFLSNFIKFPFMVYRYDAIKKCVEYVKTDWMKIGNQKDRAIMMKNVRVGHRLTLIYFGILYSTGVFFHVAPFWGREILNEFNETVRVLAYSGYETFVDPYKSPNFEIICFTILISATVGWTVSVSVCSMSAIFVSHTCGQIDIIISRIESFVDESNEDLNTDKLRNRISFVIQYHVRILRLSETIEIALQEMCLIEVVTSAMIICLFEYVILREWNSGAFVIILTYITALIAITFNTFIICYVGELLTEKSAQIGESTYMIDWYKLPGRTGLSLIMIMDISNYPVKLTAGKMMQLSIFSFGTIIKRSFAYLSMIRTIAVQ